MVDARIHDEGRRQILIVDAVGAVPQIPLSVAADPTHLERRTAFHIEFFKTDGLQPWHASAQFARHVPARAQPVVQFRDSPDRSIGSAADQSQIAPREPNDVVLFAQISPFGQAHDLVGEACIADENPVAV